VNATSNNYIHGKFGKFTSLMKAAYLCGRENGNLNSPRDDIDQVMDSMAKTDNISLCPCQMYQSKTTLMSIALTAM
jgi:hypothetical protein